MTGRQEAKLNMYDAVIAHCDANNVIVATIPALGTVLTAFKAKVAEIHATAISEISAISGVAADKAEMKNAVTATALNIAGSVFALAASANNNELKEKVNFSRSDLLKLKDELFTATVQQIHDQADANIGALVSYGVNAAVLASFQAEITNYAAKVPAPRNAASMRSSYGDQLIQLFTEADEILKEQVDKLALQLAAAEPVFYNAYKSNRVILDPVTSATKLSGTISDDTSDVVLEGVAVQVEDQPYGTISDPSGVYTLNIPVPGTYNVIYSKSGYTSVTKTNVVITLGNNTVLNVALQPAP